MTSTITGLFDRANGTPLIGATVVFTAIADSVNYNSGKARTAGVFSAITDSTGHISLSLSEGIYGVTIIGLTDVFAITVPTGGAAHNIKDIISFIG